MTHVTCRITGKEVAACMFSRHLKSLGYTLGRYALEHNIPLLFSKGSINLHNDKCLICKADLRIRVNFNGSFRLLGCTKCISNKQIRTLLRYVCEPSEIDEIVKTLYTNKPGTSLERLTKKYGIKEGKERYEKWKSRARQDKTSFIKRYGKDEGERRYQQFVDKSKQTKDNFIKRFGEDGESRYSDYIKLKKETSPRSIDYWISLGFNPTEAKEKVKYHQDNASLEKHISKYGEEIGRQKYAAYIKRNKFKVLKSFRQKYGKEGDAKYIKYRESLKVRKGYSNISFELFKELQRRFPNLEMMYGENEFTLARENRVFYLDCFIPTLNIVIEFYGDKYHANPKLYKSSDTPNPYDQTLTAKSIWEYDNKRQQIIEIEQICLIVWEYDYRNDKDLVLSKLEEFINDKLKR